MRARPALPIACLFALAALGCDDSSAPEPSDVVGLYEATTFIGFEGSSEIDVLAEGGFLTLGLNADGTTNGTMLVPGGAEGGGDFTADLTGTWTLQGEEVRFDQAADTFIRDVAFTFEDGRLVSTSAFAEVVLTRQ